MTKCDICKYQKDCPDIAEENSIYCLAHRKIPKNFNNEYIEKQQLISFLEHKIKVHEENIAIYKKEKLSILKIYAKAKKRAYQETLDFVNKGGKE